jgi:hypothetical protein
MVRHQHKPDAAAGGLDRAGVEDTQNNPFGMIVIEQSTATKH